MTGSSVAHGLAGGVILPKAVSGFNTHFDAPQEGHPIIPFKATFPSPTHSYANGMQGVHVTHGARV